MKLDWKIRATLLHGLTGQDIEYCAVPANTELEIESTPYPHGIWGKDHQTILVQSETGAYYRYRVLSLDLTRPAAV